MSPTATVLLERYYFVKVNTLNTHPPPPHKQTGHSRCDEDTDSDTAACRHIPLAWGTSVHSSLVWMLMQPKGQSGLSQAVGSLTLKTSQTWSQCVWNSSKKNPPIPHTGLLGSGSRERKKSLCSYTSTFQMSIFLRQKSLQPLNVSSHNEMCHKEFYFTRTVLSTALILNESSPFLLDFDSSPRSSSCNSTELQLNLQLKTTSCGTRGF